MDRPDWPIRTLGELVDVHDRLRVPVSRRERAKRPGRTPYYGASGVIDSIDGYTHDGRYLLLAEDGENLRSRKTPIAFIVDGKFWANNHVHVLKVLESEANDIFLSAYLEMSDIGGWITGAAQPKLSQANLRQIPVKAPPIEVQRKVAAMLTAYDELIENNLRRIEILEEMAQAIYREWFVDFRYPGHGDDELVDSPIGPIPEEWETTVVGGAFEIVGGATPSTKEPEFWEGGTINWFTPSDLTGHKPMVISESSRQISQKGLDGCSARLFPAGSVMMTSRATLGVVAINSEPACTNQGFITCLPNERVSAEQIYFWIRHNVDHIIAHASGATFKEISKRVFQTLPFTIAPAHITEAFAEQARPMVRLIESLVHQNANLRATRDLLLPKLVSGEIDVSDLDIDTSWLVA